ncbi:ATP-binding protein [Bradyrhizobium sp. CB2312]|uniref:sensor histidine kinase n=1 Tax=Bradyrhizobium sp. CB2312 TaxID=3039155 RepID=UPI0024B0A5B0|nr:ATP-binding protein [Bradyrhizobium sp. CB2312]WFU73384.1 ATP-binding protein [Bradyrhizobium sp. CB2312]
MEVNSTPAPRDDGHGDGGLLKRLVTGSTSVLGVSGGIGRRLLIRVVLFSSVVTLLLTLTQLYLDYYRDVQAIDVRMSEIDSVYSRSLSDGLWRLDERQLQLQVDGIKNLPDIRYVELQEVANPARALRVTAGVHDANAPARQEFKIFYRDRDMNQLLGILTVEATFQGIYRRLLGTAAVIMVSQAIKTFLVSFFILYLVYQIVTSRLTAISTWLRRHDLPRSQDALRLRHRWNLPDEVDHLVEALNLRDTALREAERRTSESQMQLIHSNRIATMGQLAASLAHEVNQPIGAALINAGTAQRCLAASPPDLTRTKHAIDRIVADGRRAAEVIGRIRDFVKKAPIKRERLEINDVVIEIVGLMRSETASKSIFLQTRLADDLPCVYGDRVQLQQVILNLVMNAIEAMSELTDGSRELSISTNISPDGGVIVAVSDSGPGLVNPEPVFDAFYTTKPNGLGMGLSICRSIVEAHGGRLWAMPNEQRGAVFCMALPAGEREQLIGSQ